ncbi:MAG: Sterol desaturase, partial [Myxococcaceae bacterium]|nr:Sterol desaturase [Myxococcaceae bacterium]
MPNLIALAIPFFFLGIFIEWRVARARQLPVYRLGDALADMGCGIAQQLAGLFSIVALVAGLNAAWAHRLLTLPDWAAWVVGFVGVDFVYYWWHRLSHEVNFLWAAHGVHHQSEDYNLAVALRQSVFTSLLFFPFLAVLALLGVPPLQLGVIAALNNLYQFWIHTELIGKLGPLEKIINTPSLHRVHHAINPKYLDRNHGGTFMVWDHLFGTYQPEEEQCVYGLTHPLRSFNPVWAQLDGYWKLLQLAR